VNNCTWRSRPQPPSEQTASCSLRWHCCGTTA